MVASQLNILMPVGTAMVKLVTAKRALNQKGSPTANMWWAQTVKP